MAQIILQVQLQQQALRSWVVSGQRVKGGGTSSLLQTSIYQLVDIKYFKVYIISELTFIMKRNQQRDREFSATRLSYSRNASQKLDKSHVSPSRVTKMDRDRSLTLVCNNCFNKQVTKDKASKNLHSAESNGQQNQWGLLKNGLNPKNAETHQNQVKKMREYNLQKIQQNQRKKQELKNKKNVQPSDQNYFGEESLKNSQINENKRLQLKRELQNQIAAAKQRRQREKKEQRDASPNFIIETDKTKQNRSRIEQQYKMTLLEQMNFNKHKKIQEQELQRRDWGIYELPFVKEHEQKWQLYAKAKNTVKQNVREQLKKKRESEENLRSNYTKLRELEERQRLQNEKRVKDEQSKVQQMRRTMINGYLQELRRQMQENQVKRQKEFQKIGQNQSSISIIPGQNHNRQQVFNQPCGCCSKQFPKSYLTPYAQHSLHSHD